MSSLISCPQTLLLRSLLLVLIACVLVTAANPFDPRTNVADLERTAPARRLAAAHVRTPVKSRSAELALRHDHELYYLEGKSHIDTLNSSCHQCKLFHWLFIIIQVSEPLRRISQWQGPSFRCSYPDVSKATSSSSRDARASC